jgi:hypothetical protein
MNSLKQNHEAIMALSAQLRHPRNQGAVAGLDEVFYIDFKHRGYTKWSTKKSKQ